jgi:hypothetical protein
MTRSHALVAVLVIGWLHHVGSLGSSGQEAQIEPLQIAPRPEPSDVNPADPARDLNGFDEYCWNRFLCINKAVGRSVSVLVELDHLAIPVTELPAWMTWPTREDLRGDLLDWEEYTRKYLPTRGGGDGRPAPQALGRLAKLGLVSEAAFSPSEVNNAGTLPGEFVGPLVGQNRYYVRYEIRFNRIAFEHIKRNNLHKKEFQPSDGQVPAGFPAGSVIVKAAWRIIAEGPDGDPVAAADRDFRGRCYWTRARIRINDRWEDRRVGLVGLHVIHRTPKRPQWIWSSFEQVDNVPDGDPEPRKAYSFNYGAEKQGKNLPHNSDPDPLLSTATIPAVRTGQQLLGEGTLPIPIQVVRERPIQKSTRGTNAKMQALAGVAGTPWANYQLVVTQYPTRPDDIDADPPGDPYPGPGGLVDIVTRKAGTEEGKTVTELHEKTYVNVANTTMETYFQSTSCMDCHANANRYGVAFIFSLGRTLPPSGDLAGAVRPPGERTATLGLPADTVARPGGGRPGEVLETIRHDRAVLGDILLRVTPRPAPAARPSRATLSPITGAMRGMDAATGRPSSQGAAQDVEPDFAAARAIFVGLIADWVKKNGGDCPPEMVKRHGDRFGWTDGPWKSWAELERAQFKDGSFLITREKAGTLQQVDEMLLLRVLQGTSVDQARNKQMPLNGPYISESDLSRLKVMIYNHYHPEAPIPVTSP